MRWRHVVSRVRATSSERDDVVDDETHRVVVRERVVDRGSADVALRLRREESTTVLVAGRRAPLDHLALLIDVRAIRVWCSGEAADLGDVACGDGVFRPTGGIACGDGISNIHGLLSTPPTSVPPPGVRDRVGGCTGDAPAGWLGASGGWRVLESYVHSATSPSLELLQSNHIIAQVPPRVN